MEVTLAINDLRKKFLYTLLAFNFFPAVFAEAQVQITGFDDLTFGTWGGSGDLEQADQVCVYNSGGTNFNITASGSSGSFRMISGANHFDYEVRFKATQITHATPASFTGANTSSVNCSGGTNAEIKITVREAELAAAKAGVYAGTLTFLLEPN